MNWSEMHVCDTGMNPAYCYVLLPCMCQTTAYFNAMLETSYTELYDIAAKNGYLLKTPTGQPYNFTYIGAGYALCTNVTFPVSIYAYNSKNGVTSCD